jgi:hypothetical protein
LTILLATIQNLQLPDRISQEMSRKNDLFGISRLTSQASPNCCDTCVDRLFRRSSLQPAAEHVRPELHEFRLVEASVAILVEHLNERYRSLFIDPHHILYDLDHFLRTQHAVVILVELTETLRYFFIAAIEPIEP